MQSQPAGTGPNALLYALPRMVKVAPACRHVSLDSGISITSTCHIPRVSWSPSYTFYFSASMKKNLTFLLFFPVFFVLIKARPAPPNLSHLNLAHFWSDTSSSLQYDSPTMHRASANTRGILDQLKNPCQFSDLANCVISSL